MSSSAKPRIVVADDEAHIRDVVRGYLEAEGFEVVLAADGTEALRVALESSPDLVVLDLTMPGLDGMEVLRQLRTASDVYVILLTARAEEVDKLVGLAVGADDYVTKPFSPRSSSLESRPCCGELGARNRSTPPSGSPSTGS